MKFKIATSSIFNRHVVKWSGIRVAADRRSSLRKFVLFVDSYECIHLEEAFVLIYTVDLPYNRQLELIQ